ncbi:transposase [Proteus mirabilis]
MLRFSSEKTSYFPNAKLVIDCFHIVQHIGRTVRNYRITWTIILKLI